MITVVGDLMLDRTIHGSATRLSPEAPVPVLLEDHVSESPGGAALVAANLISLGHNPMVIGALGRDAEGDFVADQLLKSGVSLRVLSHSVTTTKTRLVNQMGQQMIRWDREQIYTGSQVVQHISNARESTDLWLVSDYGKGVINTDVMQELVKFDQPVWVDPKSSANTYQNAWLVKPNLAEYESWAGQFNIHDAADLARAHGWTWLVVTMGSQGMVVVNSSGESWSYQNTPSQVSDVTGAGDCVFAVMASQVIRGHSVPDAAETACLAASRNVSRRGTSVVQPRDLERGLVFANGCFDVLHAGHLHLLKTARNMGQKLIVGINSDQSVKALKGSDRPIHSAAERRNQLLLLPWVDQVIVFDEPTPLELIKKIKPDIIVKGGDYQPHEVVGHELARVEIVPLAKGLSTSRIISQINS
jgi:D-beta-D-heptose 7-phosphate kinase / D-beta-D-heptose 1-phosphate adenosyltransferase